MESFFASLKTERVHEAQFRTRAEARAAVFEYIEVFYNRQRLHSALGYRTPAEARASMEAAILIFDFRRRCCGVWLDFSRNEGLGQGGRGGGLRKARVCRSSVQEENTR
jgi:hypothetical protein